MTKWKLFIRFNRQERNGIFFLCLIIFALQLIYFLVYFGYPGILKPKFEIDTGLQQTLGTASVETKEIYPFNPNYMTDYKGYLLGLSASQLDRLYAFRSSGKFLNSREQFQEITGVSDSVLRAVSPFFSFPEISAGNRNYLSGTPKVLKNDFIANGLVKSPIQDLNAVTAAELRRIRGIGPILSERIIRFREALGGFLVDEQLNDVYGLEPEVVSRTLQIFRVLTPPQVKKININEASAAELSQLVYITSRLAEAIVRHRELVGGIRSFDEISHFEEFPSDKIDRIKLYLGL